MSPALIDMLVCPAGCDSRLEVQPKRGCEDSLESGVITCTACDAQYPIDGGIPRMLPVALQTQERTIEDDSIRRKRSEMAARDAQVVDYDRMWYLNLFGLVEIPAMLANLALSPDHTLLEAGCGTGRMSGEFSTRCKQLVAIDYSFESLKVNAAKLRRAGVRNVELIQADICHLPFRRDAFDRTVSCQVLEHIPASCREAAVAELGRVTQPGGNIALSAYQYSIWSRLLGEKEGEHDGGIYFYRFTRAELNDLLSTRLKVDGMTGALQYHYIARCRKVANMDV